MFATQPGTQNPMGLKIRAESLPTRCEICHQSDCFEPVTNSCARCQDYVHELPPQTFPALTASPPPGLPWLVGTGSGMIFLALWWSYMFWHAKPGRPDFDDLLSATLFTVVFGTMAGVVSAVIVEGIIRSVSLVFQKKGPIRVQRIATAITAPFFLIGVWAVIWWLRMPGK